MINWTTIQSTLIDLFTRLAAPPDIWVEWRDSNRVHIDPLVRTAITLHIEPTVREGRTDDLREDYNPLGPLGQEITQVVCTSDVFTLQVVCTSLGQNADEKATVYLQRIRSRLSWRSSKAALRSVNCALVETSNLVDLSKAIDDHMASIAALDVLIRVAGTEADTANRYGWIETVDVSKVD